MGFYANIKQLLLKIDIRKYKIYKKNWNTFFLILVHFSYVVISLIDEILDFY